MSLAEFLTILALSPIVVFALALLLAILRR